MSLVTPPPSASLFSIPLEHLWQIDFSGELDVGLKRATGLARFVGDGANHLLRYVTTDDFLQQLIQSDLAREDLAQVDLAQPNPQQAGHGVSERCDDFEFSNLRSYESSVITPIVFYGPSGTGKTSLAMALIAKMMSEIRKSRLRNNSANGKPMGSVDCKPVYLTGAEFARRFYAAIETDSVCEFRQGILQCRALLLDDLQQLATKATAQKELESLLDQLICRGRPVFVVCNALPSMVDGFSERLISRLSEGLTIPFHPPGDEARSQIARDLAAIHQLQLTDDAIELLNRRFGVTVPRLEHLFGQIKLKQRLDQTTAINRAGADDSSDGSHAVDLENVAASQPISQAIDAEMLLSLLTPKDEELLQMIRSIQKRVAKQYKLRVSDIKGNSRKQTTVEARGVAIYLTRQLLGTSFLKIGGMFGNRDHSTILHSFRKIEKVCLAASKASEPGCSSEDEGSANKAGPNEAIPNGAPPSELDGATTNAKTALKTDQKTEFKKTKLKSKKTLTEGQKKTAAIIERMQQELTDQFATLIHVD